MIFTSQCNFGVLRRVRENFDRGLVHVGAGGVPGVAPYLYCFTADRAACILFLVARKHQDKNVLGIKKNSIIFCYGWKTDILMRTAGTD